MVGERRLRRALKLVLLTVITLLVFFPFIWIVFLSFKSDSDIMLNPFSIPSINFTNYVNALKIMNYGRLFKNTFIISAGALILQLIITFMSSYALCRFNFKHSRIKGIIYLYFISGLAVPVYILLFPMYKLVFTMGLINSYASLILVYSAGSVPMNTLMFFGYLRDFPRSLEEAAIIDGCNLFRLIWKIVVPISKPIFATVAIFGFLGAWNEFPTAVVLLNDDSMRTLALSVSYFKSMYSMDYGGMTAGMVLALLPQLIFFLIFQKNVISGVTAGAIKG